MGAMGPLVGPDLTLTEGATKGAGAGTGAAAGEGREGSSGSSVGERAAC